MSKQISFNNARKKYIHTLRALNGEPENWLALLIARDQVDDALANIEPLRLAVIQEIGNLDIQLRAKISQIPHEQLVLWREVIHPPEYAWWWWEDIKSKGHAKSTDLPWEILTGTFLFLSTPLIVEIIRRLWDGAPDTISILGTLLTLLITASPLVKQGHVVIQWILKSSQQRKLHYQAKIMALMALIVFLALLGIQQWLLPYPLATYYNNQGVRAQAGGNLALAQQSFRRSAALNPDRVVPYYNIAQAYEQTGLVDKAEEWYQKAIEEDVNFGPAYRGLAQIYNEQNKFAAAEDVLVAGLAADTANTGSLAHQVTRYELLTNLGWSYFGQGKMELAQQSLLRAIEMEEELKQIGDARGAEYRLALPHYYLAQIYEQAGDQPNAILQWEECLRFLDAADWRQQERYFIAQEHLQILTGK